MTPLYRPAIQEPCERIDNPQVIVLGDLFLAEGSCGLRARTDQEPIASVTAGAGRTYRLGGAGHVCQIMRDLDATVTCAGVIGNDATGWELRRQLSAHGISDRLVMMDSTRPTTCRQHALTPERTSAVKPAPIYDQETTRALSLSFQIQLRAQLLDSIGVHDAITITDDRSNLFQDGLIRDVIAEAQQHGTPVMIAAHGHHKLGRYRKAALVKLNRYEAELTTGKLINTPRDALRVGMQICQECHLGTVIITLDDDCLVMTDAEGSGDTLCTRSAHMTDPTEIDSKVLAVMGTSLARHAEASFDTQLTDLAIGLEVPCLWPSPVADVTLRQKPATCNTRNHPKILTVPELIQKLKQHRQDGQEIVFTNGCFDLLHAGHITCLTEAASLGDVLIVGMNSDSSVRQLKGPHRPRTPEPDRAAVLTTLESVDYVTIFDETTPLSIISALRPDVLVKGGTYAVGEVVGKEVVESYGGKVTTTRTVDGMSTTRILESMQRLGLESVRDVQNTHGVNHAGLLELGVLELGVLEFGVREFSVLGKQRERAPTCCEQLAEPDSRECLTSICTNESDTESEL